MKSNETKQKTMLIQTPSMEKCAIALNQNAENSVRFIRFGQELIRRAEHEGYMVLLAFWWENRGKGMPDDELRKTFHPILMYAKAQARKGILVDSPHVSYLAEPKRKKTA